MTRTVDMDSALRIETLFNVDGLVAVITGGGTGMRSPFDHELLQPNALFATTYVFA